MISVIYRRRCHNLYLYRRYARTDEIGIPYAITVDFQTFKDQCATLRERDTMKQLRIPVRLLIATSLNTGHKYNSMNMLMHSSIIASSIDQYMVVEWVLVLPS